MRVRSEFRAPWWLRGPHGQTIWASRLRRRPRLALSWERLELPDSDFVDLAFSGPADGPLVVVLHGLEGSVRSSYACGMMQACNQRGWRTVTMHFRGCSGVPNRLPRGYHSGDTGDMGFLFASLKARTPERRLVAVGYSLGGNALLKYLAETGTACPLAAACAVSVPFDLGVSADRLASGLSRFYQWILVSGMKRRVGRKLRTMDSPVDMAALPAHRTFREFDDAVTAPLHGFRDVDHYYRESSCAQYLGQVRVPTLIVQAEDDPFMRPWVIPDAGSLDACVRLEVSAHGGHVGFVQGPPWAPQYWLEQRIPAFLAAHLAQTQRATADGLPLPAAMTT